MEDCPSLGSDVGGIFWEWSSLEGDVNVAHTFMVQSWKRLKTPSAMNSAVEGMMVDAQPDFFEVERDRFFYQNRKQDTWEIGFAQKVPDGSCQIALYWLRGEDTGKIEVLLRALRKGYFRERSYEYSAIIKEATKGHNELELGTNGRLVIDLHQSGEIFFEDKQVSDFNLPLLLQYWNQKMKAEPYNGEMRARLHLRAEKNCRTEDIKRIVYTAEQYGIKDVIFGTLVLD